MWYMPSPPVVMKAHKVNDRQDITSFPNYDHKDQRIATEGEFFAK